MYIAPNSTIVLCKDVPLDDTYQHTIYFADKGQQQYYFTQNRAKYTLNAQSYTRVERGKIRVQVVVDNIYDCNYLAFQNTAYGNKWFYAFITGREYINNETSEITFDIDSLQTYWFDYMTNETSILQPCFVEREHADHDVIGDNILPEPVETGEYVYSDFERIMGTNDMAVIVMYTESGSSQAIYGEIYDGIYGGCKMQCFQSDDKYGINQFLSGFATTPDNIIAIYICPAFLLQAEFDPNTGVIPLGGTVIEGNSASFFQQIVYSALTGDEDFDGYQPKNKKLYTYPYNFCKIDNASGQSLNLRYEFFKDGRPYIEISGTYLMPVKLVLRPMQYKGVVGEEGGGGIVTGPLPSTSENISLESYPMCSWAVDSFKTWIAQNTVPTAIQAITGTIDAGIKLNTAYRSDLYGFRGQGFKKEAVEVGTKALHGVANVLVDGYKASIAADLCRGNISQGNVNITRNLQNFYKMRAHVTRNYAEMIDNFFNMFGYATNTIKVPNVHVRQQWTYTKTCGCLIKCNAPADDVRKICQIFDNGITFWASPANVGKYNLPNGIRNF